MIVVIPARNERGSIIRTVKLASILPATVVVVDDGSSDGTGDVARGAGATVVEPIAPGSYARAIMTGIDFALGRPEGDRILTVDCESHNPLEAKLMMAFPADVVFGTRIASDAPISRRLLSWSAARMASGLLGMPVRDATSGFRLYSPRAATSLVKLWSKLANCSNHGFNLISLVLLRRAGYVIQPAPITYRAGKSELRWTEPWRVLREVWELAR